MALRTFMSINLFDNSVLSGESTTKVFNPYTKANLNNPVELIDWSVSSEEILNIGSQSTGTGAGKVTFNDLKVSRPVDKLSQQLFVYEASGTAFKYLDILVVDDQRQQPGAGETTAFKPFLSYRFGLVGISGIATAPADAGVNETTNFEFGLWLIGYQQTKPDNTLTPFAPTGWDRIRNIAISGSTPPIP